MGSQRKKSQVVAMLKESILQLCKVSVTIKGKAEVDGIICISSGNDEMVIKMHETFRKEDMCTMETRAADTSSSLDIAVTPKSLAISSNSLGQGQDDSNQSSQGSVSLSQGVITQSDMEQKQDTLADREEDEQVEAPTKESDGTVDIACESIRIPFQLKEEPKDSVQGYQSETHDDEEGSLSQDAENSSNHSLDLSSSFLQEQSFGQSMDLSSMFGGFKDLDGSVSGKTVDRSRVPKVLDQPMLDCLLCDSSYNSPEEFHAHNEEAHRKFVCAWCTRAYSNRANLERHTRLHTGYRPYMCPVCSHCYTRKDDLKNHMLKHSNLPKPYRCGKCNRNYAQKSVLRLHFRSCHNSNLHHVCVECGLGFGSRSEYIDHSTEHLNSMPIMHNCSKCSFKTTAFVTYVEHELTHTVDHVPKEITDSTPSPVDPSEQPGTVEIHAGPSPVEIIVGDKEPDPEVELGDSPEEILEMSCLGCDAEFQDKVKFSLHFDSHAGEKENIFECAWCSEIVSSLPELRKHERDHPEYAQDMEKAIEPVDPDTLKITNVEHVDHPRGETEESESLSDTDRLGKSTTRDKNEMAAPTLKRTRNGSDGSVGSGPKRRKSRESPTLSGTVRLSSSSSSRESTPTKAKRDKAIEISDDESNQSVPLMDIAPGGFPNLSAVAAVDYEDISAEGHPFVMAQPVPSSSEGKVSLAALGLPSEYTCSICKQVFLAYEEYEYHLGTLHGKCACMLCGQMFGNTSNRERHIRLHTGEKPYHCQYCNEGFVRGDMRKFHEAKCPTKPGYSEQSEQDLS